MTSSTNDHGRTEAAVEDYAPPEGGARHMIAMASVLRHQWKWVAAVLVAAGAGVFFLLTQLSEAQQQPTKAAAKGARRAVPVGVAPVKTGDVEVKLTGLGTVTPLNTVTVKSRIDGQLMRVLFREGQLVKSGDVLAEIDSRSYVVQLKQAEAQLARDQALLKNAQLDLERYRVLHQQESIAKQLLDTQESLVRQHESTVKMDLAAIENARLQVEYCRIIAPVSGRVGLRQVDPGNMVHASDANGIVIITQLQPINVVFTIAEDKVPEVTKRLGAGGSVPVDAYDRSGKTRIATGTLVTLDNQIDPATGTVKLKAQFANEDRGLFPNQFVNVRMLVDVKRSMPIIPLAAVQRGTQGTFVYAVKPDHTVTVRNITLGPTQNESVAVDAGLKADETVVLDGADRLREGAKVEVAGDETLPANDGGAKTGKKRRKSDDVAQSGQ